MDRPQKKKKHNLLRLLSRERVASSKMKNLFSTFVLILVIEISFKRRPCWLHLPITCKCSHPHKPNFHYTNCLNAKHSCIVLPRQFTLFLSCNFSALLLWHLHRIKRIKTWLHDLLCVLLSLSSSMIKHEHDKHSPGIFDAAI